MSSPTVLLNNLVQEDDSIYIDPISKTFLIGELVFGLNRLPTFGKIKNLFIALASAYSFLICAGVIYISYFCGGDNVYAVVVGMDGLEYLLCITISVVVWQRLHLFFKELQKFDQAVGCRPKTTASAIKNVIQMVISFVLVLFTIFCMWFNRESESLQMLILTGVLVHIVEVHFYGHLLSLLVPRLRLINYYMRTSLNDNKNVPTPKVDMLANFKTANLESQNCQMKKLMELYCIVISSYDLLIDAIKWQFLVALTLTFISVLSFSYLASLMMIRGTRPFIHVAMETALTAMRLLPMFAPCLFGDQIHDEVRRLRELLASRLYENKLNKSGRSVARALLALTEARNLSFSLLQIFDIDISLPFKFMGLLLTYLIILLQFEKVINPTSL